MTQAIGSVALLVRDYDEEPRTEPYGTVAVFTDLYGNRWDLLEPRDGKRVVSWS